MTVTATATLLHVIEADSAWHTALVESVGESLALDYRALEVQPSAASQAAREAYYLANRAWGNFQRIHRV